MTMTVRETLTDADREAFRRDGYLRLGTVLDAVEVRTLQGRADALARGWVVNHAVRVSLVDPDGPPAPAGPAPGYLQLEGLETDNLFRPVIERPLWREVCAELHGAHAAVCFLAAMVVNRPAGAGPGLPWHQHASQGRLLDREPQVSAWIALDPASDADGGLEVLAGSHRLGLLGSGAEPSLAARAEALHADGAGVLLDAQPGEGFLLHGWLIQRSGSHSTAAPRRAFSMVWADARTRDLRTGERCALVHGAPADDADPRIGRLRDEREAQMRAAQEAREQRDAATARWQRAVHDNQDLRVEQQRLRDAVRQNHEELMTMGRRLADVAAAELPAAAIRQQQAADNEALRATVAQLRQNCAELAHRLDATHASRSWRVTLPLRRATDLLRRR